MNERWVCKRCFADNEESAGACVRCGLIRGAEATPADQQSWAAQAPQQPQQAGWTKWLRLWWIPALVVVLAVGYVVSARRDSSGQIESAGTVSIDDLRVGDCFNFADEDAEEFGSVDGVPCSQPHAHQIFHIADHPTPAYPTEADLASIFATRCVGSTFESFVGMAYLQSTLEVDMTWPTEDSYAAGNQSYICFLYDPSGADLTATMQGARR